MVWSGKNGGLSRTASKPGFPHLRGKLPGLCRPSVALRALNNRHSWWWLFAAQKGGPLRTGKSILGGRGGSRLLFDPPTLVWGPRGCRTPSYRFWGTLTAVSEQWRYAPREKAQGSSGFAVVKKGGPLGTSTIHSKGPQRLCPTKRCAGRTALEGGTGVVFFW